MSKTNPDRSGKSAETEADTEGKKADGRYSQVTNKVRVSVQPAPQPESSDPDAGIYAFSYAVTIENIGNEAVQLLERHWKIFSADKQIGEVVGPGVVGRQPLLEPGSYFEYTSGAVINDPFGHMQGSYTFRSITGKFFDVTVPTFNFIYPAVMH